LTAEPNLAYERAARDLVANVNQKISDVERIRTRRAAALEQRRSAEGEADRLTASLTQRKQEAKTQQAIIEKYLELRVPTGNPKYMGLLLSWLFGIALDRLIQHGDSLATTLLGRLETLRTRKRAAGQPGPAVNLSADIGGFTVKGLARHDGLDLAIGVPRTPPLTLIASDAPQHRQERAELVTELAKGFIHETAHLWQLRQYQNVSHPWSAQYVGGQPRPEGLPLDEIPLFNAPADVRSAYAELAAGGVGGAAKDDPEWQRAFKAMTHPEYYRPGPAEDSPRRDQRAREIVSHLMEIVYAWNSPEKFRRIFPACSALLDRVISKGGDAT
jgi:hypothetical protein